MQNVVAAAVSNAEIVETGAWHKRLYISAHERPARRSARFTQEFRSTWEYVHVNLLRAGIQKHIPACR